ncbi:MAG: ATP-binding protein [Bacillota bacterium]
MEDNSKDLFRYERRILKRANKVIDNEEYQDNKLFKKFKSLAFKYKKLLRQSEKILKISDNNQRALRKTQNNLSSLLNNAGQGFLTFGEDLLIAPEYSLECKKIFGQDIAEKNCLDVIFKNSDLEIVEEVFRKVFAEDSSKVELYLSLLPEEMKVNNKLLEIKYKFITEEEKIMCIITDITEKRELENKLETERHNLKMAVTAIVNQGLVKKYINDFREYFTYEVYELLGELKTCNLLDEMYRKVHTFKGVFAQWGMNNTAKSLHQLEDEIVDFRKNNTRITKDDLLKFIIKIKSDSFLEDDISIIKEILGENFLNQDDTIMVSKDNILQLEEKVKRYFPNSEKEAVLNRIKRIIYKPMQELIGIYEDYIYELAEREGKKIESLSITGEEVLVDEEIYHDFNKSLIHIFRNIIYHGIEEPNQRLINDKSKGGTIACQISEKNNNIVIKISDDGQGIDLEKIKKKAVDDGLYTTEEVQSLSTQQVVNLIFVDSLSTKEEAGDIAGRGIGMASVKSEVSKLGGHISVRTEQGKGTEFEIVLPNLEMDEGPVIKKPNFLMGELQEEVIGFLEDDLDIVVVNQKESRSQGDIKVTLSEFNVITNIRFNKLYDVIISADYNTAEKIMNSFVAGEIDEEQKEELIKSSLSEILNITVGHFLDRLNDGQGYLETAPTPIAVDGNLLKYEDSEVITEKISTKEGEIYLNLIERWEN